jgi:hypothetical protein
MMGGGFKFRWRQTGDFAIEVYQEETDSNWSKVDYAFENVEGKIIITFEASREAEDWVTGFTICELPLSGL